MKPTNIYTPTIGHLQQAAKILTSGGVIAFPTETVYGLGANALDADAVAKIYQLKGRPQDNPIISHVGKKEQIARYAYIRNDIEQTIIDELMPGPITILLPPKEMIPSIITAGHPLMSIRIPNHPVAQKLLALCDFPIAAPSANISTKPSPTSAKMVYDNLMNNIPIIIDGGRCPVGIESTVVKVEEKKIIITRPGSITKEDLELLFNYKVEVVYGQKPSAMTPGNRYKHYAPDADVSSFTSIEDIKKKIASSGSKKIAIIATKEFLKKHEANMTSMKKKVFELGSEADMITCAKNLFSLYHTCDKLGIENIYIQELPQHGIGYAIMNRVNKSITRK